MKILVVVHAVKAGTAVAGVGSGVFPVPWLPRQGQSADSFAFEVFVGVEMLAGGGIDWHCSRSQIGNSRYIVARL